MPAGVDEAKWAKAREIADKSKTAPKGESKAYWKYVMGIYKKMIGGSQKEAEQDTHGTDSEGWIGVDWDGTLFKYTKWKGPDDITTPAGEKDPKSVYSMVKSAVKAGKDIRIVTARVAGGGEDAAKARKAIENTCKEHFGKKLPVTYEKDKDILEIWDDRAVQVEKNTGRQLVDKPTELDKMVNKEAQLHAFLSGMDKTAGFGNWLNNKAAGVTGKALETGPGQAFLEKLMDKAVERPVDIGYGPEGSTYASQLLKQRSTQHAAEKAFKGWLKRPGNKAIAMREAGGAAGSYAKHKIEDLGDWIRQNPGKASAITAALVGTPLLIRQFFKSRNKE